jgi:glycosyltransferase involved in cell wall biosynthesis
MAHDMKSALIVGDDIEQIKAALQKLRLHTKLRAELGAKLKNDVELKHSWSQSALALVDAVWELCGGRRRG